MTTRRLSREVSKYGNDPVRYIEDKLLMPALRSQDAPGDRELNIELMEKCWSVEGLLYEALYECVRKRDSGEAAKIVADVQRVLNDIPNPVVRDCLQRRIRELFACYGPNGRLLKNERD